MAEPRTKRRKKAANGRGGITKRGDGLYMGRVTVLDPETGLRTRKTVYGKTAEEAHQKLVKVQAADQDGAKVLGRGPTLKAFAGEWLAGLDGHLRVGTVTRYRECLAHLVPDLGGLPLTRITPTQVSAQLKRMHEGGLKSRTCNRSREVLRNMLNEAQRRGLVARNVAALARRIPESDVEEEEYLRPEEIPTVVEVASQHREGPMWITLLWTGMRLAELQGLRWQDVDLERGTITIRRTLRRVKGQWVIKPPKTARGRRTVALTPIAVDALRGWKALQAEERLAAGATWDTEWDGYVWTRPDGRVPHPTTCGEHWRKVMDAVLGRRVKLHGLRHTAATHLLALSGNERAVADQLGHIRPSFTRDRYQHTAEQLRRDTAGLMDRLLQAKPM